MPGYTTIRYNLAISLNDLSIRYFYFLYSVVRN